MGFTSYDDLITKITSGKKLVLPWAKSSTTAGVALNWYHLWSVGGIPAPGALYTGTALQFQRTDDATAGAFYNGGDKSPDTKHLTSMSAMSSAGAISPTIMIVDMVGYYPITPSGALQTMDNTNPPNRYTSAGQSGLLAVLVNGAATGATAANISSLNYVDQDGNSASMPTSPAVAVTVSAALPTGTLGSRVLTTVGGPFIPLAANDTGMRSITDVTWSAANTGLHAILMVKPLVMMPTPSAGVLAERDLVMQLANLERIYDGACISIMCFFGSATGSTLSGFIDVAWGS